LLALVPYRPDLEIDRIPIITAVLCLLCILVFLQQRDNHEQIQAQVLEFCKSHRTTAFRRAMISVTGSESVLDCIDLMLTMHDPVFGEHQFAEMLTKAKPIPLYSEQESKRVVREEIEAALAQFESLAPKDLTSDLAYQAGSWDVMRMWSSTVAHGGWEHLIGNLIGFLAFGMFVEAILGTVLFSLVLLAIAVIADAAFSIWNLSNAIPAAVIGLSGVVYGMMGMLAYFWPGAKVRCLLWIVVLFKRISMPVWILAVVYVGWDSYDLLRGNSEGISLISHVSGGISGFLLGWLFFRWRKKELQPVIELHG
jgi:membrane associated rhomboid family serine protease